MCHCEIDEKDTSSMSFLCLLHRHIGTESALEALFIFSLVRMYRFFSEDMFKCGKCSG